jgi:hypothetical protein
VINKAGGLVYQRNFAGVYKQAAPSTPTLGSIP